MKQATEGKLFLKLRDNSISQLLPFQTNYIEVGLMHVRPSHTRSQLPADLLFHPKDIRLQDNAGETFWKEITENFRGLF